MHSMAAGRSNGITPGCMWAQADTGTVPHFVQEKGGQAHSIPLIMMHRESCILRIERLMTDWFLGF